jgi:hypothetical protein
MAISDGFNSTLQVIEGYCIGVVDESNWVKHFSDSDLSQDVPPEFWQSLLRLVASRHYEQACILLRRLLLDCPDAEHREQVALVLNRLLEAPSPAMILEDPDSFQEFVHENREILSGFEWHEDLGPIISLLQGNVSGGQYEKKVRLGAELLYPGIPFSYEEISARSTRVLGEGTCSLDRIMSSLLCFDISLFQNTLMKEIYNDSWVQCFAFHIADLLYKCGLVQGNVRDAMLTSYANELIKLGHTTITLSYAATCQEIPTDIVFNSVILMDIQSLPTIQESFKEHPLVVKECQSRLRAEARRILQTGDYTKAFKFACDASDESLKYRIMSTVLEAYAASQHVNILGRLSVLDTDWNELRSALEGLHHVAKTPSVNPEGVAKALMIAFRPQIPLPPRLIHHLLDIWCRLPDDFGYELLMTVAECMSKQMDLPPDLEKEVRVKIMKFSAVAAS